MQDVFERDDELSIPDAGYEFPRMRRGTSNRRLAIIAGLIGVGLVGIGGGLELASRRSTGVPVIVADTRPIRVRPDNPGGMQVIGANEGSADAGAAEAMAPPPETPDTLALRTQQKAELAARSQPATPAAAAQPAAPQLPTAEMLARSGTAAPDVPLPPLVGRSAEEAPATAILPPAHGRPGPALPASASAIAPPPAAAAAPKVIAPAPARVTVAGAGSDGATGGHHVVQLAAVASQDAANSEWERLSKRMPDLLSGRQPEIVKFEHDGHTFFRVRTGGFADTADAGAFCARVHAKGGNCAAF